MTCPHCHNADPTLIERLSATVMRCDVCSKEFPARQRHLSVYERLQLAADAGQDTWEDYRGER